MAKARRQRYPDLTFPTKAGVFLTATHGLLKGRYQPAVTLRVGQDYDRFQGGDFLSWLQRPVVVTKGGIEIQLKLDGPKIFLDVPTLQILDAWVGSIENRKYVPTTEDVRIARFVYGPRWREVLGTLEYEVRDKLLADARARLEEARMPVPAAPRPATQNQTIDAARLIRAWAGLGRDPAARPPRWSADLVNGVEKSLPRGRLFHWPLVQEFAHEMAGDRPAELRQLVRDQIDIIVRELALRERQRGDGIPLNGLGTARKGRLGFVVTVENIIVGRHFSSGFAFDQARRSSTSDPDVRYLVWAQRGKYGERTEIGACRAGVCTRDPSWREP